MQNSEYRSDSMYNMNHHDPNNREAISNVNVGETERILSLFGGAGMILFALSRGVKGLWMAIIGAMLIYRGTTGHSVVYDVLGYSSAVATNRANVAVPHQQGIHVVKSVIIDRPVEELYHFWRNFENLPRFMKHLESVTVRDSVHSFWTAKGPAGTKVSWEAEIVNEVPYEVIGWRSLANADIANAGSVRFSPAPGGQGTEVRVTLEYVPPAGKLGVAIAKLFGEEPELQVSEDLDRFKQLMETGEVSTTDGQSSGRESGNE
jgi:uncharacterized membrane protein